MENGRMKNRKWHSLIDKAYSLPNLLESWYEVKENKGRGGVNRESIEEFERNLNQNLKELHRLLKEKRYIPSPVRQVLIPKPNSDRLRPLGMPTVKATKEESRIPENGTYGLRKGAEIASPAYCGTAVTI